MIIWEPEIPAGGVEDPLPELPAVEPSADVTVTELFKAHRLGLVRFAFFWWETRRRPRTSCRTPLLPCITDGGVWPITISCSGTPPRGPLIYQHTAMERDGALADALGKRAEEALKPENPRPDEQDPDGSGT
ncbi:hypothetical protein ABZ815_39860 [Nonomuraea sp. NPDC047529]|uniref:hypothetical protein n=1 Tax=Nonomuraea sp. NPDC047529 TaxID=3155623 RepID=UPI0033E8296D